MRWREGYCAATAFGGDCSLDTQGAFTSPSGDACVEQCKRCERCRFVSFSKRLNDCSWFSQCDMQQLELFGGSAGSYTSVRVKP